MSTETHPEAIVTPQQCNHSGPASQAIYDHVMRLLDNPHRWEDLPSTFGMLRTQVGTDTLALYGEYAPNEEGASLIVVASLTMGDDKVEEYQFPATHSSSILDRMKQVAKAIKDTEANTAAQKFLDLLTQPATR